MPETLDRPPQPLNPEYVSDYTPGGMIVRLRQVVAVLTEIAPNEVIGLYDAAFDGSLLHIPLDDFNRFFAGRDGETSKEEWGDSIRHTRLWRGVVVLAIEWVPQE